MKVQIFDVEHGGCALVTAPSGARLLIDCGHNSTTGWRPSSHLPRLGIERLEYLFVTNKDEDHVSDLPRLRETISITNLRRNPSLTPAALATIKEEGGIDVGISELIAMIAAYTAPAWPIDLGGMTISTYYNSYPLDFDDTNNLSMVVFLRYQGLNIVFPGDLETAGWLKLLERPDFVRELATVIVLVASHHGRASGCCEEMFQLGWNPDIVIFSDAGIQYETQATVPWYAARAQGITYAGQTRSVFTTRKDGRISLDANSFGFSISTAREEAARMNPFQRLA